MFFMGGLMGSLTHCLTMCGPVVACQAACGGACGTKMNTASQWQYHAGRFFTYGLMGFFAAMFSLQLAALPFWPVFSRIMMVLAGLLFLVSAAFPKQHKFLSFSPKNMVLRGVMMSFMPCGLIYAALMMAATLSDPFSGMVAMWIFVLGTLPVLLLASSGAAALSREFEQIMNGVGRLGMACNGLALLAMAARVMR